MTPIFTPPGQTTPIHPGATPQISPLRGPRFMGVDTGEICSIAVRELTDPGHPRRARWVYFEAPPVERLVERCRRAREALGVEAAVVDSGPYRLLARQVQDQDPENTFLWSHAEGEMRTAEGEHLGAMRKRVLLNREELLESLLEEAGGMRSFLPAARTPEEEELLALVGTHLKNLRRKLVEKAGGKEAFAFERNENHFGFAMAYARLAEELAIAEGLLVPHAGGYAAPPGMGEAGAHGRAPLRNIGLLRPVLGDMGWGEDPGSYARARAFGGLRL